MLVLVLVVVGVVLAVSEGRSASSEAPPYDDVGVAMGYHALVDPPGDIERALDRIAGLGARWVRFDLNWSIVEAERGMHDWRQVDRFVDAARERGLDVLATIAYTPSWARDGDGDDKLAPRDVGDYARFAGEAARRYPENRIAAWELWNEPNSAQFWAPRPDAREYARLATAAARAIHDERPDAVVMSGGLAPAGPELDWVSPDRRFVSPWRFLRDVRAADGLEEIDAVAFHPYAAQPSAPSDPGIANPFQQTRELRRLVDRSRPLPIWATEAGAWTGGDRRISERAQARHVAEYLEEWHAWPRVGPFFYYELTDSGEDPDEREDHFGLIRADGTEKPAYATFDELVG
jgi:hypothetical protein